MKKAGLVLGIALGVLSQPAFAEGRLMKAIEVARACAGDVRRLCHEVRPGGGRIKACIKEKLADVSPACHEALVGTSVEPTDAHFDEVAKEGPADQGAAAATPPAEKVAGEAATAATAAEEKLPAAAGGSADVVKEGAAVKEGPAGKEGVAVKEGATVTKP